MHTLTVSEVRGLGRWYARMGLGAGEAYRTMCRTYPVPVGSWAEFADAYADELKGM